MFEPNATASHLDSTNRVGLALCQSLPVYASIAGMWRVRQHFRFVPTTEVTDPFDRLVGSAPRRPLRCQCDGIRPHGASVLQEDRRSANIHASSGFI
jgi:hypothetical protein